MNRGWNDMMSDIEKVLPRSEDYSDKTIVETGFILIEGIYYYKRIFPMVVPSWFVMTKN